MTLKEFEREAEAGGYNKELNAEYYRSRTCGLQRLCGQMVEFSKKCGMTEQLRIQKGLAKQYQSSYYLHAYDRYRATGQLNIKLNYFSEQQLENIVYSPWKDSDFSKRIWKEYTEILPDGLTDTMLKAALFRYSPSRVVSMLRDRFRKVSNRDLHRLVITETGRAVEETTAQFYKDSDIEQYQYLATLKSHTCDQYAHLDERIFNVKDKKEDIDYPLIHPYCRYTTVSYDRDLPNVETRWDRGPETGEGVYVKDMNYSEWNRSVRQKRLGYQDWEKVSGAKTISLDMLTPFISGAKCYPAYDETEISMNQEQHKQNSFTRIYYKQLRNSDRQKQIDKVTQSSNLSRDTVCEALIHVLDSQYDLLDYKTMECIKSSFAPEIGMAHSLQRLINGEPIDHDTLLLQHETLEAKLMDNPKSKCYDNYGKTHKETNKKCSY